MPGEVIVGGQGDPRVIAGAWYYCHGLGIAAGQRFPAK